MKREIALRIPLIFDVLGRSQTKPVYTKILREKISRALFEISKITKDNQAFIENIEKEFQEAEGVGEKQTWGKQEQKDFILFLGKHKEYLAYLNEEVDVKTKITLDDLEDSEFDIATMSVLFGNLIEE